MDETDLEKASFACHMGLFNFRVMPFVLSNALGVFTQLMFIILSGMDGFAMSYLDDFLVFSRIPEEHFLIISRKYLID